MENQKSEKEDKSDIEIRLTALEEKLNLVHLQGGLVTPPNTRFSFGANMPRAYSTIGPVVYPTIFYDALLPTLKSDVREINFLETDPEYEMQFLVNDGWVTFIKNGPEGGADFPAKLMVTFSDGQSQEHIVLVGSVCKLDSKGGFMLWSARPPKE